MKDRARETAVLADGIGEIPLADQSECRTGGKDRSTSRTRAVFVAFGGCGSLISGVADPARKGYVGICDMRVMFLCDKTTCPHGLGLLIQHGKGN